MREREIRHYTFWAGFHHTRVYCTVSTEFYIRTYTITHATYSRFMALANSGNYRVVIPEISEWETVAWQLQRHEVATDAPYIDSEVDELVAQYEREAYNAMRDPVMAGVDT